MEKNAAETVSKSLRLPDRLRSFEDPEKKWGRLTDESSKFAASLRQAVSSGRSTDFDAWDKLLADWALGYSKTDWWTAAHAHEWETVQRLLGSARRVALNHTAPLGCAPGQGRASCFPDQVYDSWFAAGRRGAPYGGLRTAVVPVALCDERNGSGYVADLTLELFTGSGLSCARHPTQAFVPAGPDFIEGLDDALEGALSCATGPAAPTGGCGVLWTLRSRDSSRVAIKPDGRSTSGAAALALLLAFENKAPSCGVLVIADVDPSSKDELRPTSPSALGPKVEGIAQLYPNPDGRLSGTEVDKIVVVTAEERARAESVLKNHFRNRTPPQDSPICVVTCT